MSDLNRVIIIGRLTRDPEKKYTQSDTCVTKFSIAVNNGFGDKKKTAFIDITTWGKTAEFVSSYFTKGKEILVEGRLEFDQWESKEGDKRSKLYVTGERVSFVGSKDSQAHDKTEKFIEDANADTPFSEVIDDETIPF